MTCEHLYHLFSLGLYFRPLITHLIPYNHVFIALAALMAYPIFVGYWCDSPLCGTLPADVL